MKFDWRLVMVLVLSLGLMVGCTKDEEDDEVGNFETLSSYMQENGLDLPDQIASGWVKPASAVVDTNDYTIPGYTVLDIRATADYNAGHIKGAIDASLGTILADAEANPAGDNGYLVVCYSGQSAGHASMALRLMGYTSTVLKWGMSGWNADFSGSWESNAGHDNGNNAVSHASWVTTAAPALETYDYPAWESETTEGAALLVERIEAALEMGFQGVAGYGATGVLENLADYQIVNFWPADDYLAYGHYDGAYQLKPISLAGDEVKHLDPSMTTALYCYTGQTSSTSTFWMNVLGYDVKSIKFGVNTLNYDGLYDGGEPNWHGPEDYEYEVTP